MKKAFAIIAAFIVVSSFSGCGLTSSEPNNSIDESNSDDANKIYTIDEICQRADEEKRFASEHSDEVFTIHGTIDHISYKSVYFKSNVDKSSYSKYQVKCEFEDSDKVKDLSPNDIVTISGKLYHLIISEVTLKDCTLISADNSSDTSENASSTSTSSGGNTSLEQSSKPANNSTVTITSEPISIAAPSVSSVASKPEVSRQSVTPTPAPQNSTSQTQQAPTTPQNSTSQTQQAPTTPQNPEPPVETPSSNGITLVSFNNNLRRNEDATIKVKGKPNTQYSISVYYSSGASTADGLEPKMSDSDGYVSWTWHIGGKTSTKGTKKLTVKGGGETFNTTFTVSE